MATKRTNNPTGRPPKDSATPTRARVGLSPDQAKKMSDLLKKCVAEGLKYAEKVLSSKEQVEIIRFTRDGIKEKLRMDKYPPDLKIKLLEILIGKVFAEKKDIGVEPGDENAIHVVGFNFVPVPKKSDTEQEV